MSLEKALIAFAELIPSKPPANVGIQLNLLSKMFF